MKLQLPSAVQLLLRYGASELTQIAVPDSERPIAPELLQAAAEGAALDDWPEDEVAIATIALARIADAVTRARSELAFYLRFRAEADGVPAWVTDDLAEMARYHLFDDTGKEESTVRTRYKDVILRLETLAREDEARGAAEGGRADLRITHNPRLMSRRSLGQL
ncbi:phage protein Gp36 family protein [Pseudomonas aeruginosa]|uniref:phage protein Gp36 family protein n=1 Tax=Pseudomonas aeruginosa TaxID=287 RepID=UPI000BB7122F|nr:phage protein Gp36 family protein [Pseudomonas aeruginosa]AXR09999.1 DUF1320 domain-containing protein [Pseudomonas aeruginosa]EIU2598538.1 DUF1320 family protein [Pseudomonas aeruginosa]EIU2879838.1 DUF1320 family protein [Pseudomonas aeruginosa]ELC7283655.1 DUF1320 family protein [Pseudomonas aeruginosa]ELK4865879.1 DUF1320 family protein [Pseudomonas aeruginosa]